jgi:hypothetical protein
MGRLLELFKPPTFPNSRLVGPKVGFSMMFLLFCYEYAVFGQNEVMSCRDIDRDPASTKDRLARD